jgi:hypothetical protein
MKYRWSSRIRLLCIQNDNEGGKNANHWEPEVCRRRRKSVRSPFAPSNSQRINSRPRSGRASPRCVIVQFDRVVYLALCQSTNSEAEGGYLLAVQDVKHAFSFVLSLYRDRDHEKTAHESFELVVLVRVKSTPLAFAHSFHSNCASGETENTHAAL